MDIDKDLLPFKDNKNIGSVNFFSYIVWAMASAEDGCSRPLGLPPVQRTALWTPKHVLGLWDSILRGMPIGMFYLIHNDGKKRRTFYDNVRRAGSTVSDWAGGYDLLDGQQRTRAMMLAMRSPKEEGRCLWVELGAGKKGRIDLRLTTRSQPFGYDIEGSKLSLERRRKARESFDGLTGGPSEMKVPDAAGGTRRAYDHELFDLELERSKTRPPYPAGAVAAVPLGELIFCFQKANGDAGSFKESILSASTEAVGIAESIERLLPALEVLSRTEIPLVLVKQPESAHADSEWLLNLFERIGSGGVPLSEAERLYSIYKYHEPYVHDTVISIEDDIGRVLTPTQIAGTGLRIAAAKQSRPSFDIPGVAAFAKAMDDTNDSDFKEELHRLIPPSVGAISLHGSLKSTFQTLYKILSYNQDSNKTGIPKVMLVELPHQLIQVLTYWIELAKKSSPDLKDDDFTDGRVRSDVIRFCLFWYLCGNNDKAARQAFRVLHERDKQQGINVLLGGFPGRHLYDALTAEGRDRCALSLVRPNAFRRYGTHEATEQWRSWKARFEREDFEEPTKTEASTRDLFRTWWGSGGKMLLWLQRQYLALEFKDYDPSTDRDDEKPYDLDHIQPKAAFDFHWNGMMEMFDEPLIDLYQTSFYYGRDQLGNSIGNYRWIGSSVNRSNGDMNILEKLNLKTFEASHADLWINSAFNIGDETVRQTWSVAGGEGKWSATRLLAFQQAVEERAMWLYEEFWRSAGFDEWFPG